MHSDEANTRRSLGILLEQAVKRRLVSDVPVGTFLSGGTDSSLVTAIAQKLTHQPVKTFSIGFKESKFDESQFARKVAEHLKTDHHEFILSQDDALERMEKILEVYDQPYADSSAIPTMMVSEMARKHVTVALSGDGGDELFMGYGMYNWARRLNNPWLASSRPLIHFLLNRHPDNRYKRAAHLFARHNSERKKSHIFSQEQYMFGEGELENLLQPGWKRPVKLMEKNRVRRRELSPQEEQALFDLKYYLKDDLLVKVDMASMRYGLEVRVPLLDHRVVQFALNIDQRLKVKGPVAKYILKEVLYSHVPAHLFDRPKWGFSIPLAGWLKKELRHLPEDYLSEESVAAAGVVDPAVVKKLKEQFFNGADYLYNRLWLLVLLHKWLREFNP